MMTTNKIVEYLEELIPNPVCELDFKKDYELLLAVMLSAQTTDKKVNKVTKVLFEEYPTLEAFRDADIQDLESIIMPIGTYHIKALNIKKIAGELLDKYNGKVPNDRKALEQLSGVGRKTTNVVLNILYGESCIAVDTHVARVSARLGLVTFRDSPLEIEKKLMKKIPPDKISDIHHRLLLFGRYYCKAKNPNCVNCRLSDICKEKERK